VVQSKLVWQSKLVLLLVLPVTGADVVLEAHWWAVNSLPLAIWTVGLSLLLGIVAFKLRSATAGAAVAGAFITASLMFSTAVAPYQPWNTAIVPVFTVLVLTALTTRLGRAKKESMGLAEKRQGRTAAQVAANLGFSAIVSCGIVESFVIDSRWFAPTGLAPIPILVPMLAALCEAAADTVSSEIGQVFGGRPIMITSLRRVDPGTDGGLSLAGTLAGLLAAGLVAMAGAVSIVPHNPALAAAAWGGGVFGLLFDSLLGATLERQGWLNNDLVNFLSTASASGFALMLLSLIPHASVG